MLTMLVIWIQETTMAWGHARINKVDRALAAGETVDFEAENQAMSDQIRKHRSTLGQDFARC